MNKDLQTDMKNNQKETETFLFLGGYTHFFVNKL